MFRNPMRLFRLGKAVLPPLNPVNLNPSAANEVVRRLGLFKPISGPLRIVDGPSKGTKKMPAATESKPEISDSEKRMKEREGYKAYREQLERRRKEIISSKELKETLKKADEAHRRFSRYG